MSKQWENDERSLIEGVYTRVLCEYEYQYLRLVDHVFMRTSTSAEKCTRVGIQVMQLYLFPIYSTSVLEG